jgi:hypothetical protein
MKPGDMAQIDEEKRLDRDFRATIALGAGIFAMLFMATMIGFFLGWLTWGI